jgi:hypothetical protein
MSTFRGQELAFLAILAFIASLLQGCKMGPGMEMQLVCGTACKLNYKCSGKVLEVRSEGCEHDMEHSSDVKPPAVCDDMLAHMIKYEDQTRSFTCPSFMKQKKLNATENAAENATKAPEAAAPAAQAEIETVAEDPKVTKDLSQEGRGVTTTAKPKGTSTNSQASQGGKEEGTAARKPVQGGKEEGKAAAERKGEAGKETKTHNVNEADVAKLEKVAAEAAVTATAQATSAKGGSDASLEQQDHAGKLLRRDVSEHRETQ